MDHFQSDEDNLPGGANETETPFPPVIAPASRLRRPSLAVNDVLIRNFSAVSTGGGDFEIPSLPTVFYPSRVQDELPTVRGSYDDDQDVYISPTFAAPNSDGAATVVAVERARQLAKEPTEPLLLSPKALVRERSGRAGGLAPPRGMARSISAVSYVSSVPGMEDLEIEDDDEEVILTIDWKKILKDYASSVFVCIAAGVVGLMIMVVLSRMNWTVTDAAGHVAVDKLNLTLLACLVALMAISSFVGVEFIATFGMGQFFAKRFYLYIISSAVVMASLLLALWYVGYDVWFYYVDVYIIVGCYVLLGYMLGYYGSKETEHSKRVWMGLYFLAMEVIVSATAVLYAFALMPVYGSLDSTWRGIWRVTLHPLYFELFNSIPVRYMVGRKMKYTSISKSLAVVHSQAHITSMGRYMLSNVGEMWLTAVTVLLVNAGKLGFRLTAVLRDKLLCRGLPCPRVGPAEIERAGGTNDADENNQFVRAVSLHADIIMDNSSILMAALSLFLFQPHHQAFMLPFPPGDQQTVLVYMLFSVIIQYGVGFVFDFFALFFAAKYAKLPISFTWDKMKRHSGSFFGFLIFGGITMGHITTLYMLARVPRRIFCDQNDLCSCQFLYYMCEARIVPTVVA